MRKAAGAEGESVVTRLNRFTLVTSLKLSVLLDVLPVCNMDHNGGTLVRDTEPLS